MDVKEGETAWGGVDNIGQLGSFYVSISSYLPDRASDSLTLVNVTADTSME